MSIQNSVVATTETSSTLSTSSQKPLIGKWDLYYHLPHDKKWDLSSYKKICDIQHVNELISINEYISETIVKNCMLFVMKKE